MNHPSQSTTPNSFAATPAATRTAFAPLSIVIPTYRAAKLPATPGPLSTESAASTVLGQTLTNVFAWLDAAGFDEHTAQVIVVDDGSNANLTPSPNAASTQSDRTADVVASFARPIALLKNTVNRGKGYSVRRGALAACGVSPSNDSTKDTTPFTHADGRGWVLFMDVDNSTPIRHLDRFAPFASNTQTPQEGTGELLIASRRTLGSRIVKQQYRIRQILGRTFPYVVRTLALPSITDTQCGFKVIRADIARRIYAEQRVERFAFDVELLMLAHLAGAKTIEIPADWENPPESTLRVARDAPQMLLDVFRTMWRLRKGGPTAERLSTPLPR